MGIYSEYLDRRMDFLQLTQERKKQLQRISRLRGGRAVLVFAADLQKANAPISMNYSDLTPIKDQLANLHEDALDVLLETPGGSGEAAEDIVRLIRQKYDHVGMIIPGWAKSAGTLLAVAADEILMGPTGALGPVDAQMVWQGKVFSAGALLEGLEKIKREVKQTGALNRAYIPILQGISPGELQSAENALEFARALVTKWLATYKFRHWTTHTSTGKPVTDQEKERRAKEIAGRLCDHQRWLTHGRSVKIADLEEMGLKVIDYTKDADLSDAIERYHTLMQMTFESQVYKIFETPDSQIYRFLTPVVPQTARVEQADMATIEVQCHKCKNKWPVQANLDKPSPLQKGSLPFPADNKLPCPNCGSMIDLSEARRQVEIQSKKRVVPQEGGK